MVTRYRIFILSLLACVFVAGCTQGSRALNKPLLELVVDSRTDSGPGSLRQALRDAQTGDRIIFDPAVFPPDDPKTIPILEGLPILAQGNLAIDASNAGVILDGRYAPRTL